MDLYEADCLEWMRKQPDNAVDLTFGSPPYEDARTYGVDFKLRDQQWVDWMVERMVEMLRITSGLVAMVVEGKQRNYRYSATPMLLMADLHRRGIHLKKPPAFQRQGIPGSGQKDWLRNDYEFIVCATSGGKLPWSDNKEMGHEPKFAHGGGCSNRKTSGERNNAKLRATRGSKNGDTMTQAKYAHPDRANPGNVIKCKVGGGHMGSPLAHENEAPFPESLAEFFVRSFCPPGGTVLDPFCGSGTTLAVAQKFGRQAIGVDVRANQIDLTERRLAETPTEQ